MNKKEKNMPIFTTLNTFSLPVRILGYALLPLAALVGLVVGILRLPFTLASVVVRRLTGGSYDYKAGFFDHLGLALKSRQLQVRKLKLAHRLRSRRGK